MVSIEISPALPWWGLAVLSFSGIALVAYGMVIRVPSVWLRGLFIAVAVTALLNPSVTREERDFLPDVVAILVDESASQSVTNRLVQVRETTKILKDQLLEEKDLDIRFEVIGNLAGKDGTYISESLIDVFSDVPFERISGAFIITDGQIHDAPTDFSAISYPLHFFLTGGLEEQDRHLVIEEAPTYVIVGEEAMIRLRVDGDRKASSEVPITLRVNGEKVNELNAIVGTSVEMPIVLESEGVSAIELEIEEGPDELTIQNNHVLLAVNGVRSRLSVMLVSGSPGPGLRSMRNLLKADPAVDLVHFTVLRPPNKQGLTPVDELSLIPFPSDELFSVRLREFDLIIFDRYHRRGILPTAYLNNIADYVIKGGAVMDIAGPSFVTSLSLAASPLGKILPARPTGKIFESAFVPTISERGYRHPVTSGLEEGADSEVKLGWGRWFRLFDSEAESGEVLLTGVEGKPLLVLDRVGEGRVAQLLSDQSWLWGRGYEGGGPQQALMRRLVHWLMKQPDLEEDSLSVEVDNRKLTLVRRSLDGVAGPVKMVGPDGLTEEIPLSVDNLGLGVATRNVLNVGVYRLEHDDHKTVAIVGETKVREIADVRASEDLVKAAADATGGSIVWLEQEGVPRIVRSRKSRIGELEGAVSLVRNEQYQVTGSAQVPIMPGILALILLLGCAVWSWRMEGR